MRATQRVAKNSFLLIAHPLILNIISIFVIGYIARMLGQADYGKFVFAFTFATMFNPVTNMGLRTITVRDMAENNDKTNSLLGKMLFLRFLLSVTAVGSIFIIVNLMNYPALTKAAVYIASFTIIFQAIATTFHDAFQAGEQMQYVAYAQFFSGVVLTALSIIVLFIGCRLIGLSAVYCLGSFLGALLSVSYFLKRFGVPGISIDFYFWKKNLYRGFHFFYPNLILLAGTKTGVIFLSKMAGDMSVSIYGAANYLVEKLIIIPDGICTAFFPTMAILYKNSKEEAGHLFRRFFLYLFLLGLPIAVGATVLAKPIINKVYGAEYHASILVLQILAWGLFLDFLNSILAWSLGAIHQEKKIAMTRLITTPFHILLNILLIPHLKEIGVAVSGVITGVATFAIFNIFQKKYLTGSLLERGFMIKIIITNIALGFLLFLVRKSSVFVSIPLGAAVYLLMVLSFNIMRRSEVAKLWVNFTKKKKLNLCAPAG